MTPGGARNPGEGTMQKQIGDAAGMIWKYLDQHTESTLSELKQPTKLSEQLLLMGLGWLAREDKLNIVQEKKGLKVSLKGR
jgi:hypothetical protein